MTDSNTDAELLCMTMTYERESQSITEIDIGDTEGKQKKLCQSMFSLLFQLLILQIWSINKPRDK